jgi:hypothetical protein
MPARKISLAPIATGLVLANIVVIGVVIACLFVTRRAWALREDALAALAEVRADARVQETIHAPPLKLRASTMDRMLLCGILGVTGSAFVTWRLVSKSSPVSRLRERAGETARRSRATPG